jgi:hypothetical protein
MSVDVVLWAVGGLATMLSMLVWFLARRIFVILESIRVELQEIHKEFARIGERVTACETWTSQHQRHCDELHAISGKEISNLWKAVRG